MHRNFCLFCVVVISICANLSYASCEDEFGLNIEPFKEHHVDIFAAFTHQSEGISMDEAKNELLPYARDEKKFHSFVATHGDELAALLVVSVDDESLVLNCSTIAPAGEEARPQIQQLMKQKLDDLAKKYGKNSLHAVIEKYDSVTAAELRGFKFRRAYELKDNKVLYILPLEPRSTELRLIPLSEAHIGKLVEEDHKNWGVPKKRAKRTYHDFHEDENLLNFVVMSDEKIAGFLSIDLATDIRDEDLRLNELIIADAGKPIQEAVLKIMREQAALIARKYNIERLFYMVHADDKYRQKLLLAFGLTVEKTSFDKDGDVTQYSMTFELDPPPPPISPEEFRTYMTDGN